MFTINLYSMSAHAIPLLLEKKQQRSVAPPPTSMMASLALCRAWPPFARRPCHITPSPPHPPFLLAPHPPLYTHHSHADVIVRKEYALCPNVPVDDLVGMQVSQALGDSHQPTE